MRLLIANRGEIACRIIATCRKMGLTSIVTYTEHDRDSLAVREADLAVLVSSYLDIQENLTAARKTRATAVHPGFGFLAENADFAQACAEAGLLFVGPSPDSMRALGSKANAKELAMKVGVPVLPTFPAEGPWEFPLMIKASAGGGGKGMRRVAGAEELEKALPEARAEAQSSFGDATLVLEKALDGARHIEVQILGDRHGRVIHLGERDCSLQRRHQKILEESPAPGLSEQLRWHMQRAAVKLAEAARYHGAGTVEYLVAGNEFYFLEMNTRLQVEHPVTEAVTGVDLVEWQIRVAQGEPIAIESLEFKGHAIEVRLYAEDHEYRPCPGQILLWRAPTGIRVETGVASGDAVSPFYDPMVAKLIAWGEDRPTALRKLRRAVEDTCLLGVTCNQPLLLQLLDDQTVKAGAITTGYLDGLSILPPVEIPEHRVAIDFARKGVGWRNNASSAGAGPRHFEGEFLALEIDGVRHKFLLAQRGDDWWVWSCPGISHIAFPPRFPLAAHAKGGDGSILAPLTGTVLEVLVGEGESVTDGQPLLRLEAMKMVHTLTSPGSAKVAALLCSQGEVVAAETVLVRLVQTGNS